MAATSPRKKPVRKMKSAEKVRFELPDYEGEFEFTTAKRMPATVSREVIEKGSPFPVIDWLKADNPDLADLVDEMSMEEQNDLVEAWTKASGMDLGESGA